MPEPDRDRLALIEIVESSGAIRGYLSGFDEARFLADRRTCDAVAMHVLVIGEAVGRLGNASKAALGDYPWDLIRGVRNRIAHGYASINFVRLWIIATVDIPALETAVRRVVGDDPDLPPLP